MPMSQGKVYAKTQSENINSPHVITCSLMICNSPNFVLFDSGATNLFISPLHAKTLNRRIEPLEKGLLISTPYGVMFLVELVCRDCEVSIKNVVMKVDLTLFELDELDVILGMSFLTKYHAILDCSNKEVVLRDRRKFEFKFIGN